ncbi:PrgI family protein [Actinomadura sp. SCN-SB]|uniref:PrgI family protein n=1 Tax=Actinomadura sp. SCN-SB TaxID=3373092 RepID=UPI00375148FE
MSIPADIDREDKILADLSPRQLAILIPAGAVVWLAYLATDTLLPLPVFAAFAVPLLGVAAALALAERDGVGLDRLLWCALQQTRQPRRLVLAGDPPALPGWAVARAQPAPESVAPLRLPAQTIRSDGVLDLGEAGVAVVVACSTVSFALRTQHEQAALVGAFGGWLNSLSGPTQILVHAAPINLTPTITTLREWAGGLPHPQLENAALDHAGYLAELAATRDLLARQVLVVLREAPGATPGTGSLTGRRRDVDGAAARAMRRAEAATRALAAAGITATVLDAAQATAVLTAAADPTAPPTGPGTRATAGEPVTAITPTTDRPVAGNAVGRAVGR